MAKIFTAAGNVVFSSRPNQMAAVAAQGNANDFTWQVEFSLDSGTTWSVYKDSSGVSLFTGADAKEIRAVSKTNRVKLVNIGTATTVYLEGAG